MGDWVMDDKQFDNLVDIFVENEWGAFYDSKLKPWLEMQTVSPGGKNLSEMNESAEFFKGLLDELNFDTEIIESEKYNPVVHGYLDVGAEQTVTIYGHGDVMPADSKGWELNNGQHVLDPFRPEIIDGVGYGRGFDDDKGQVMANLFALCFFNKTQTFTPCNIRFILDHEEEIGSPYLTKLVNENPSMFETDAVIVSDSSNLKHGVPAIKHSLRGAVVANVNTDSPKSLISLIDKMHDPITNTVSLEGFYTDIVKQEVELGDELANSVVQDMKKKTGLYTHTEEGFTFLENVWYRPSFSPVKLKYANQNPNASFQGQTIKITAKGPLEEVHSGGYGGPTPEPAINLAHFLAELSKHSEFEIDYIDYGSNQTKTSIWAEGYAQITFKDHLSSPASTLNTAVNNKQLDRDLFNLVVSPDKRDAYLANAEDKFGELDKASSTLTFRLVNGQDPDAVYRSLEKFVGEDAEVDLVFGAKPFNSDTSDPYFQAVIAAGKKANGAGEFHIAGNGGSIPLTTCFQDRLGVPVILNGYGDPDSNAHGALEHTSISGLVNGAKSMIYSLRNIAKLEKAK